MNRTDKTTQIKEFNPTDTFNSLGVIKYIIPQITDIKSSESINETTSEIKIEKLNGQPNDRKTNSLHQNNLNTTVDTLTPIDVIQTNSLN